MPDVRMPDGTIIRNVPAGTTKAQLVQKLAASKAPSILDGIPGYRLAQALLSDASPGSASDMFTHDATMGADVPLAGAVATLGQMIRAPFDSQVDFPASKAARRRIADQGMAQRRAEIAAARAQHPVASGLAEAAGAITSLPGQIAQKAAARLAPNLAKVPYVGKALALVPSTLDAAAWGGATGASEGQNPVSSAGLAAAGNVAGSVAMKAASRALSPILSRSAAQLASQGIQLTPYQEAVRTLNSIGTKMTPGQIGGGSARTVEDALATLPVIGSLQKAGQRRALSSFNLGAINDAISPVGQLPKGVRAGRDAVGTAQTIIGNAYNKALKGVSLPLDDVFHAQLSDAMSNAASNLTPDQMTSFRNDIGKFVRPFVGSEMAGEDVQAIKRGLDARIAKYVNSSNPADEHLADALGGVRSAFMDNFQRRAPESFAGYQAADQAYRNMAPINDAAAKNKEAGVITPLAYSTATARRGFGNTTNKIARGDATGQDIANAASMVLPAKLPSSGTAERAGIMALLSGSGAAAHFFPPAAAPAAALSLPYLPLVDRVYQAMRLGQRPQVLQSLASGLQLAAPAGGLALAPLAIQQGQ